MSNLLHFRMCTCRICFFILRVGVEDEIKIFTNVNVIIVLDYASLERISEFVIMSNGHFPCTLLIT